MITPIKTIVGGIVGLAFPIVVFGNPSSQSADSASVTALELIETLATSEDITLHISDRDVTELKTIELHVPEHPALNGTDLGRLLSCLGWSLQATRRGPVIYRSGKPAGQSAACKGVSIR